ncbi:MAG: glycosyltransferase, partial [Acutalibacteraceae bacterium]
MPKVCIMTSAHTSRDVRIYHKQAVSLAKAGYEVILLNNHETAEDENGIRLINVGAPYSTRRERIIKSPGVFFEAALKQKADIYHIHDPELIKTAVKLRRKTGASVIFDSHEDTPRQVLTKEYIPSAFRPICAWYMDRREKRASVKLSAIITATRHIEDVFKGYGCKKTVTVNNYPLLSEYSTDRPISREKENAVCYVGG